MRLYYANYFSGDLASFNLYPCHAIIFSLGGNVFG